MDNGPFEGGAVFHQDTAQLSDIGESDACRQFDDQVEESGLVALEALGAQGQQRSGGSLLVVARAGLNRQVDTAGVAIDPSGEFRVVARCRAHAREGMGEERQQGQVVRLHGRQVEGGGQVENAAGGLVVAGDGLGGRQRCRAQSPHGRGDVGSRQGRQDIEVFVLLLLFFKCGGLRPDARLLVGCQTLGNGPQCFFFACIVPRLLVFIRKKLEKDTMRVLQQPRPDALFEKGPLAQPRAQFFEIAVEVQNGFRTAPVKPGAGEEEQQFESVGIGRVGDFLAVKFDLMDGRFDQVGVDALVGQPFEGRHDEGFDGVRVFGGHILEPAEKQGVAVVGVETAGVGQR